MVRARKLFVALAVAGLAAVTVASAAAEPWRATRDWSADDEVAFSDFVAAVGRGVAAGRCHTLAECLNDAQSNPLHDAREAPYTFHADCADVPYVLRALFAQRHGLPFAWTVRMRGRGRDARYYADARPDGWHDWRAYPSARRLFAGIAGEVHSGHFRTAADVEGSDFINVRIERGAVRPGTTYYDPNGHVLVVYEITDGGDVLLFDGHPDGSITHTRLGQQALGGPRQGGGFKNFRPLALRAGRVVRVPNVLVAEYDRVPQGDRRRHRVDGRPVPYVDWVRDRLRQRTGPRAAVDQVQHDE